MLTLLNCILIVAITIVIAECIHPNVYTNQITRTLSVMYLIPVLLFGLMVLGVMSPYLLLSGLRKKEE